MASHSSALKAHRQSLLKRERNRQYRTRLRHALKALRSAIAAGKADEARTSMAETVSLIDRLVSKGVVHRNAASRYKSRLMKHLAGQSAAA